MRILLALTAAFLVWLWSVDNSQHQRHRPVEPAPVEQTRDFQRVTNAVREYEADVEEARTEFRESL